ncbi:MAG: PAS domain S-box protein [Bacteroidota bacterium]|nr:PAS domain S-box protein [Bacteroidota bacterium]
MNDKTPSHIFREIARHFPSVAFVWRNEPGWPVEFVSENVEHLLGYQASAFITGDLVFSDLIHPDDRERITSEVDAARQKGAPDMWEHSPYRLRASDGSWVWVQDKTISTRNEHGEVVLLEGILTDISTSVNLARDLEKSMERLREIKSAVSSSSDLFVLISRGGEIRYANRAFRMTFNLLDRNVEGTSFSLLGESEPLLSRIGDDVEAAWGGESRSWTDWVDLPLKPHQFVKVSTRPYLSDDGSIRGSIVTLENETVLQERQAELSRLEKAIEQVSESVVLTDSKGTIEYVNPFFEKVTGYSKEEAVGNNPRVLKGGTVPEDFYRDLWATIQSGRTWKGRLVNRRKSGELFTEDATISPIQNEQGDTTHYVAVKRDVSSEVALTQQLHGTQQIEAVSQIYRNMLQELNRSLSVVLGHAEYLNETGQDGLSGHASVATIVEKATDMSALIHSSMQRLHRHTEGGGACDMCDAVNQSSAMLARILSETASFKLDLPESPIPVGMSSVEVDQILTNLVLNAEHAIGDGGAISVSLREITTDGGFGAATDLHAVYAQLVVEDTGIGMDENTVAQMFDQFFTTKSDAVSSGLGLWSVKQLVDRYEGTIDVASKPGVGTRVTLTIPSLSAHNPEQRREAAVSTLKGRHVVVVDDDPALLDMTTAMLELEGITVTAFREPERVVEWLKTLDQYPDALVTDILMPAISGPELADMIRTQLPTLPVVFMSGYSEELLSQPDESPARYHFLQKPFDADALLQLLAKAFYSETTLPLS